jgi:quercetin dioxygenase-like cupin family protein
VLRRGLYCVGGGAAYNSSEATNAQENAMQVTHAEESDKARASNAIRGGAREFKTLLAGEEGSPNNFKLSFVRQSGALDIPRHKHNFDQVRMCLEGERQNYGKNKWIEPGELVYFPEGTPYGPEKSASHRLSITLQFAGASGSGYVGTQRMQAAMAEMRKFGTFDGGVFTRGGALAAGQRRNQDSFEAIWEFVHQRKIVYPKPRYDEPVRIRPQNFAWLPLDGQKGVATKSLGVFSERRSEIAMMRLDAGAEGALAAAAATRIGFVTAGAGAANGRALRKHTAFTVERGEACRLAGGDGMELLLITLPLPTGAAGAARH